MPSGARPGERRGGRPKGGRNKSTIERLERAALDARGKEAEKAIIAGRATGTKLAKEVLEDFMHLFAGIAGTHQPYPPTQPQNVNYDEDKFERYAKLTIDTARELAKYQSPQFRAIVVAPAPDANKGQERKRFTLTIFEGRRPMLEGPEHYPEHDDVKH